MLYLFCTATYASAVRSLVWTHSHLLSSQQKGVSSRRTDCLSSHLGLALSHQRSEHLAYLRLGMGCILILISLLHQQSKSLVSGLGIRSVHSCLSSSHQQSGFSVSSLGTHACPILVSIWLINDWICSSRVVVPLCVLMSSHAVSGEISFFHFTSQNTTVSHADLLISTFSPRDFSRLLSLEIRRVVKRPWKFPAFYQSFPPDTFSVLYLTQVYIQ